MSSSSVELKMVSVMLHSPLGQDRVDGVGVSGSCHNLRKQDLFNDLLPYLTPH